MLQLLIIASSPSRSAHFGLCREQGYTPSITEHHTKDTGSTSTIALLLPQSQNIFTSSYSISTSMSYQFDRHYSQNATLRLYKVSWQDCCRRSVCLPSALKPVKPTSTKFTVRVWMGTSVHISDMSKILIANSSFSGSL